MLESRWPMSKSSSGWRKLRLGVMALAELRSGIQRRRRSVDADEMDLRSSAVVGSHLGMLCQSAQAHLYREP